MAYEIGTASGHYDLLTKFTTFVTTTIPLAQRWQIQRSHETTVGTLVGITYTALSGNYTATVETVESNNIATGDRVIITGATQGAYNGEFVVTRYNSTKFTYSMLSNPGANATGTITLERRNRERIFKAPGYSGTEEIYMGIKTYQLVSGDFYNWKLGGFTGYVPDNEWENQPGIGNNIGVPLWNNSIPYVFIANGQRAIISAKVENIRNTFYLGKYLPYATPYQYPYPLCVAGCLPTAAETRYSDTAYLSFFQGTSNGNLQIKFVDGLWKNPDLWPYNSTHQLRNTINLSGTATGYYGIHPIVISTSSLGVLGEFEGLYYISGYNNTAENTIVYGGDTYYIVNDVWRTGFNDYIALRLT